MDVPGHPEFLAHRRRDQRSAGLVLLVGASGELSANLRHTAFLARRLLEFKVSTVVDLYELKLAECRRFVKLFLESLIHLLRELWRPTLVILDEANIYCPEPVWGSGIDRGGHQPDEPGPHTRLRRHHRGARR